MSESSLIVIVLSSLVYPYFKLDVEQDKIRQALLIKQESEWIEWFCSFFANSQYFGLILSSIRRWAFITEGRLIKFYPCGGGVY